MSTAYQALLQEFVPRPISSQRAYQRMLKKIDELIRKANAVRLANYFGVPAERWGDWRTT